MRPTGDADRKAVESSLETRAALARPRRVLLASPRSFCAGVERAIRIVEELLDRTDGPVYVRKQIVHNAHVVSDLESRGAGFVEEVAEVPIGATVVFSAQTTLALDDVTEVVDALRRRFPALKGPASEDICYATTNRQGTPAYLIDDAGDIRPDWLTGVDTVRLTAGASAPPALVSGVIAALSGLGPVSVIERETSRETVHFAMPSQVLRS